MPENDEHNWRVTVSASPKWPLLVLLAPVWLAAAWIAGTLFNIILRW